jgi:hypothetical protein
MVENEKSSSLEIEPSELFVDAIGKGGLPIDLGNDASSVNLALKMYEKGKCTEAQLRDALKGVREFDKYFRDQLEEANAERLECGEAPYDIDGSLASKRGLVDPNLIEKFNGIVSELHSLSDDPKINTSAIRTIISDKINSLIHGENNDE